MRPAARQGLLIAAAAVAVLSLLWLAGVAAASSRDSRLLETLSGPEWQWQGSSSPDAGVPRVTPRLLADKSLGGSGANSSALAPQSAASGAPPPLPLSTRGRWIVDAAARPLRLRCVSWSGSQESGFVPSGLQLQHRDDIARRVRSLGLNCVRLVWSLEAVLGSEAGSASPAAVVPQHLLAANPDLQGLTPLAVLDAIINTFAKLGMLVVLDNHTSDAIWCCNLSDGNGLWYTNHWSEQQWLDAWAIVAQRYANSSRWPTVVGMGLRNEPRPAFVHNLLRWPTWGFGGEATDLAVAYEKAAAVVLAARPSFLVFAQGLMAGRDLRAARFRPLVLRTAWPDGPVVPNQLVYEVHEYPFLWGLFDFTNYPKYASRLDDAWGYLLKYNRAPVWLGEFGVEHSAAGINSSWFQALLRYIKERDLDWSYWALDGTQGPSRQLGAEETYGLLNTTWDGWAYQPLVDVLTSLI